MEPHQGRFSEHLAVKSALSLREFCDAMQRLFALPEFEYDYENDTEWGLVEHEGIEYNVSRPFEEGMLHQWDDSAPPECNFGITLSISNADPELDSGSLVPQIGQALADVLKRRVHHHRTWLGPGNNVVRERDFHPSD